MDVAVEVWLENESTLDVFLNMQTQWRVGMAGATGLDYGPLPFVMRTQGIKRSDWATILDGIRVMEIAALEEMHRD